jgi:hypothetical protein
MQQGVEPSIIGLCSKLAQPFQVWVVTKKERNSFSCKPFCSKLDYGLTSPIGIEK